MGNRTDGIILAIQKVDHIDNCLHSRTRQILVISKLIFFRYWCQSVEFSQSEDRDPRAAVALNNVWFEANFKCKYVEHLTDGLEESVINSNDDPNADNDDMFNTIMWVC